jgi:hypothetical protein
MNGFKRSVAIALLNLLNNSNLAHTMLGERHAGLLCGDAPERQGQGTG